MMTKTRIPLYLDFEYRNINEPQLDLLCCAYQVGPGGRKELVWLESRENSQSFASKLHSLRQEVYFVSYSIESEARCIFQLFDEFDLPYLIEEMRFHCLLIDYRMLQNNNDQVAYGKQLIAGEKRVTKPPKSKYDSHIKKKGEDNSTAEYSLASACYKMLDVEIDTEHKNEMRDLIISGVQLSAADKKAISEYCVDDIAHLPNLQKAMLTYLHKKIGRVTDPALLLSEAFLRGEFGARTAKMVRLGYPYAHSQLKYFSSQVENLINKEIESINERFPEVKAFQWNKKSKSFIRKEKEIRQWIKDNAPDFKRWTKTAKGAFSLSIDAFKEQYELTDPGFGGAYRNFLKFKQDLNGFMPIRPGQKRKSFWNIAGSDHRARPYFGIYGSQSARSQPSSTGFIPLKSHWMRSFIQPQPGKAIVACDYSSQEFLISALLSEDMQMINAYASGDPYVYFAKLGGAIPENGTKDTHSNERDVYKTATLGIGYLMGAQSLANHLTKTLGTPFSEEEGADLINKFREAYPDFAEWQRNVIDDYAAAGPKANLKLPCGWYMWGDNKNPRSVGNFPIQGFGSSVMRKAVALAQDEGLDVIFTLHDALYVEYPSQCIDYTVETLKKCMDAAFRFFFPDLIKQFANIRMDVFCWSPDYKNYKHSQYPTNHFYLDKKGFDGYNKFREYLDFS